jgi:SPP1 gp7 family putative phage head morphogenesis protein
MGWEDRYGSLNELYEKISSGKLRPQELNKEFVLDYVNTLQGPFKERFKGFGTPDYRTPNYNQMQAVNNNIFFFAGAKTYRELKAVNDLFSKNGKIVSFSQFQQNIKWYGKQVGSIDKKYRQDWLRTEYNMAVKISEQTSQWQKFYENQDIYPNLEYIATLDGVVRDEHRLLHGTVRPVDDSYWDSYAPPNDWNCRCRLEPTRKGISVKAPEIGLKQQFKGNPAKTGQVFKDTHPYYPKHEELKEQIKDRSSEFAQEVWRNNQRKNYEMYKGDENYERMGFDEETGGFIVKHKNSKVSGDEHNIAKSLKGSGDGVVFAEYHTDRYTKNFDCWVNSARFDLKESNGSITSVRDRLLEGAEQANFILIKLNSFDYGKIKDGVSEAVRKGAKFKGLIFLYNDKRVFINTLEEIKKIKSLSDLI